MKHVLAYSSLLFFSFAQAQDHPAAHQSLVLTVGYMSFGTGDTKGYSVATQYAKGLTKRVSMSGEAFVENGHRQPENASLGSFNEVSNVGITIKVHYYPFTQFLKGVTLAGGPTFGYQSSSYERAWQISSSPAGFTSRQSILGYDKGVFVGYRVSINYNLPLKGRFVFGGRVEFSNYSNGDVNLMAGLRGGVKF